MESCPFLCYIGIMIDSLPYALSCVLAGFLSFLSPCVLPLIPSYLCIIGGTPQGGEGAETSDGGLWKPRLMAGTVSFILGFSAVFIVLSIIFSVTFLLMGNALRWINWISGAVVIVLGLNIIFDFLAFLNYEKRFHIKRQPKGIIGAFLTGAAFGAGWTPCIGPVLAGVLLLAAQSGGIPRAALYLACYSAGLGLPFLLASGFFNVFIKASSRLRPRLPLIRKISGALLVAMGVLIVTGQYRKLNAFTARWQTGAGSGNASAPVLNDPLVSIPAGGEQEDDSPAGQITPYIIRPDVIEVFSAAGLPVERAARRPEDFTLPLLDGTEQTLSGLREKVVFLNFWGTWCPPCRKEMPSMERLHQGLKDKGLVMIAVNGSESAEQVSGFMLENNLTFPVALDANGRVTIRYGVRAIPTTYIINRRGLIVSRMVGAIEWDSPEIIKAFEVLLGE